MTASRELHHFLLLTRDQQVQAIRRLQAMGMSDQTIATATRLSVEQIKTATAKPTSDTAAAVGISASPPTAGKPSNAVGRSNCPRTGIPMRFCTCVGPHEAAA